MAGAVKFGCDAVGSTAGVGALARVLVGVIIGGVTYIAALAFLGEPNVRNYWSTRTTKSSR